MALIRSYSETLHDTRRPLYSSCFALRRTWRLRWHAARLYPFAHRWRSGDHGAIERWRTQQQQQRTLERRPDLYARWQAQQQEQQ
jgi:hypothetical protein